MESLLFYTSIPKEEGILLLASASRPATKARNIKYDSKSFARFIFLSCEFAMREQLRSRKQEQSPPLANQFSEE